MSYPINKILSNQYTSGGEFIIKSDKSPFRGYYHVIGGVKYFTEVEPTSKSVEIVKISEERITPKIVSQISAPTSTRFVVREVTVAPITYKFIDETTAERLKKIKRFQIVEVPPGMNLNSINSQQFPGLKEFLQANT